MSNRENYNGYDAGLGGGVSQEGYDMYGSDVYHDQAPVEPEGFIDETIPRTVIEEPIGYGGFQVGGAEESDESINRLQSDIGFLPITSDGIGHENFSCDPSASTTSTANYENYYQADVISSQSEADLPTLEYEVVSVAPGYAEQNGSQLTASTISSAPNIGDGQAASSTSIFGSNTYQHYIPQQDPDLKPHASLPNEGSPSALGPGELSEGIYSNTLTSDPSPLQTSNPILAAYDKPGEVNIDSPFLDQPTPVSALEKNKGNFGYYHRPSRTSNPVYHP